MSSPPIHTGHGRMTGGNVPRPNFTPEIGDTLRVVATNGKNVQPGRVCQRLSNSVTEKARKKVRRDVSGDYSGSKSKPALWREKHLFGFGGGKMGRGASIFGDQQSSGKKISPGMNLTDLTPQRTPKKGRTREKKAAEICGPKPGGDSRKKGNPALRG